MKLSEFTLPTELTQRNLAGICLTIACLAVLTLVYGIWQWQGDWKLAHHSIESAPVITTAEAPDLLAAITQQHLFGQTARLGDMPITNLQLQVTGIVKMDYAASKAYISMAGQPSKIYRTGDMLPYGVKVYDIQPDAIVLQTDAGQLEKLPLPRTALQFKAKAQPNTEERAYT